MANGRAHMSSLSIASFAVTIVVLACAAKEGPVESQQIPVAFSLLAPDAASVSVVGSFNQWDRKKHLLSGPDQEGRWKISLPLLPGRYEYLFLINGVTWVLDLSAPFVDDGMGGRNSVAVVLPE